MAIGEPAGPIDEDAIKGDAKAAAYRAEPLELLIALSMADNMGMATKNMGASTEPLIAAP